MDSIIKFLEKRNLGLRQGTPEWVAYRTIGGSDTGTLLNINPFNDPRPWFADKINAAYSAADLSASNARLGSQAPRPAYFCRKAEPAANAAPNVAPKWVPSSPKDGANNTIRTHWGHLFEECLKQVTEARLQTIIMGTDAFFSYDTGYLCYSPDGLGVVSAEMMASLTLTQPQESAILSSANPEQADQTGGAKSDGVGNANVGGNIDVELTAPSIVDSTSAVEQDIKSTDKIILFEFKCPMTRKISGHVPDYYLPQPVAGLGIIEIADAAIFIEAVFRPCRASDCSSATQAYRRKFVINDAPHEFAPDLIDVCKYDNKRVKVEAVGLIIFYSEKESQESKDAEEASVSTEPTVADFICTSAHEAGIVAEAGQYVDLGDESVPEEYFVTCTKLAKTGALCTYYCPPIIQGQYSAESVTEFVAKVRDLGPVAAILPWKMIKSGTHVIEPRPELFADLVSRAKVVYEAIKRGKNAESNAQKIEIIEEVYRFLAGVIEEEEYDFG
jgi:hypothetical protein